MSDEYYVPTWKDNPLIPWIKQTFREKRPVRRYKWSIDWNARANWRHYSCNAWSQSRNLARVKALWHVLRYGLGFGW